MRYKVPAIAAALIALCVISCTPSTPAQQVSSASDTIQPVLVCSPNSLSFKARLGQVTAMEQVINISNQGGGAMSWIISDNVHWINEKQVLGSGGTQGGTIQVAVDPSGLASGDYTGVITVTAEGALGSPYHVPVFLSVTSTEPGAIAASAPQSNNQPAETSVIWKNETGYTRYASVNSCLVSGSITNTEKWWYLSNVTITASKGSALIATTVPPGETVLYYRYIPCYQREEVKLKYDWYKP